jgi:translation elongation factor EF-Ts
MEQITLEKIDIIRERTGVTYTEAKEALEATEGNVVEALVYIEKNKTTAKDQMYTTKEEFIDWIKEVIRKGNVTRIKVKKDEKVLVDIPVNVGVVAGTVLLALPSLLAVIFLTAVFTKVTVEITREDGSVEVVNKIIQDTVSNVKEKAQEVKEKAQEVKEKAQEVKDKFSKNNDEENSFQYTVKFEDVEDNKEEK